MRDLIVGNGLIGRNLSYKLREAVLLSHKELDLSRDGWELPDCDTTYICAAETSILKCEQFPKETYKVNVEGTIRLAERMRKVVWLSSDRVFDGSVPNRKLGDEVCPTTEYGRQKAETEKVLLGMGCTVIRLSKVIGWDMPLFEGWVKDLRQGKVIHPYSNMSMSPMSVQFVVNFIVKTRGFNQISALEDLSYSRIAYHIANYIGVDMSLVQPIEAEHSCLYTTLESGSRPDAWGVIYNWCRKVRFFDKEDYWGG